MYSRISRLSQIGVGGVLFARGGVGRMWLLADMQIEAEGVLEADMQIPYFMRGEQICKLAEGVLEADWCVLEADFLFYAG